MTIESDTKLILDTFRATWIDFYRWEREDCGRVLEALQLEHQVGDKPRLLPQWMRPDPNDDTHGDIVESPLFDTCIDCDEIEVVEYPMTPATSRTEKEALSVALKAPQGVVPCPQYESCVPRQRNTAHGDDPAVMAFIPHADDPAFSFLTLCSEYDHFQWQAFMKDPNLELIVVETFRRLHTNRGLTIEHVEKTGVLPIDFAKLLHTCHGRDFLPWSPGLHQWLFRSHKRENLTPVNIFRSMTQSFCNSCATGYCSNHFRNVSPNPLPSLVTTEAFERDMDSCCSEACFLSPLEMPPTTWTQVNEEQMLICINYIPDMVPCGIAKICGKPCVETFRRRKSLLSHETRKRIMMIRNFLSIWIRPAHMMALAQSSMGVLAVTVKPTVPVDVCANKTVQESGVAANAPNPGQSQLVRIIEGAVASRAIVNANRTSVSGAMSSHDLGTDGCGNVQMQTGQVKRTSARQSTWGFGLFIEEALKKNEFIDEYVGELIFDSTARSRGHLERHRCRNYLFNLNPTLCIDSSFVGNGTRYINHSGTEPNCWAKVWIVGGEQRIGIMASRDLEAGEELLMDYGEEFFINVEAVDNSDEAEEDVALPVEDKTQIRPPTIDHSSDETYDGGNEDVGGTESE